MTYGAPHSTSTKSHSRLSTGVSSVTSNFSLTVQHHTSGTCCQKSSSSVRARSSRTQLPTYSTSISPHGSANLKRTTVTKQRIQKILSIKESSVSTSALTVSPSLLLNASGKETTTTTGVVSSRSDAVRYNSAARKPRTMIHFGKREETWRKQYIHTVANEPVTEAVEHDCDVTVFEELTEIREQFLQAKWHHVWAFRRLFKYVE